MKYDACHAAKDFVRTVWLSIDDLIYAESMVKEKENILLSFYGSVLPILRLGAELSHIICGLSAYEPLLRLAKDSEKELRDLISEVHHAEKYCADSENTADDADSFNAASQRIISRMIEDMRMTDISERLGCDYLKYMICLIEGAVRLAENTLNYESGLVPARSVSQRCRELLRNMRRLLSLTM